MTKFWEKSYPPGIAWDQPLEITPLTRQLDRAVQDWGTRPFLEFMGFTVDFRTFGELVERAARGFRMLGVGAGTHVALHLPNTPHFPIAFYGVLKAGGVVVNLSPLDAEREIAQKLVKADVRLVVSFEGLIDKLPKDRPDLRVVMASSQDLRPFTVPPIPTDPAVPVPFAALLDPAHPQDGPWPEVGVESVALLQFTGGTTGIPKAAMLTHANLSASVSIYEAWGRASKIEPGNERFLTVLPLFHIFALTSILLRGVRCGYTLILKARWDTDDILDTIARLRPTLFAGVPTMYRALASHPRIGEVDFSCFKYLGSGGAPLPLELATEFQKISGHEIHEGWGMSETSPAGTSMPAHRCKTGSTGLPLPGITIEIRDPDDPHRVLPIGQAGEICIKGPNVMAGYYKQPEETDAAFVDGFFKTGDIGYLDEDGFMFIVDRKKDMILSGGYNVYPRLIEEAIYDHPAVAEVVVIGIPDSYRGESAKAFVTLRPGHAPFTLEELRAFLDSRLGRHELPSALEIRDALPKTAVGKLWKKPLVDEERAKAATASSQS